MGCEFPSFCRAAFQAQFDGFPHIAESLSSRAALADTAGDHRTLRNYVSVLAGVEYDWQFHVCREYHLAPLPENGSRIVLVPIAYIESVSAFTPKNKKRTARVGGPFSIF